MHNLLRRSLFFCSRTSVKASFKTLTSWFTRDPNEKVSQKLFAFYTEDDVDAEDIKSEEIRAEETNLMS